MAAIVHNIPNNSGADPNADPKLTSWSSWTHLLYSWTTVMFSTKGTIQQTPKVNSGLEMVTVGVDSEKIRFPAVVSNLRIIKPVLQDYVCVMPNIKRSKRSRSYKLKY